MIEIIGLTKIYKAKKGAPCLALNNVSFTLPDKGMIFILGKSGSGKSTFMNLLGGLDTITSGEIIADGKKFSEFTEKDYSAYRNSYAGFVFQDFCLIESFSVKENIALSLDLQSRYDEQKVNDIIKKLDLESLQDRMPKELSGGQRQRVAIARALIKEPKLILADEPTGNLDSISAKQVLVTLKELSTNNLVVVVSHNPDDAEKYGDRIIEIADGKILHDVEKNNSIPHDVIIGDNEIILPDKGRLSENDLKNINEKIHKGNVVIKQAPPLFNATKPIINDNNKQAVSFDFPKIKIQKTLALSGTFLNKKLPSFVISVLMVTLIIVMFGLCQLFASFDEYETLNKAMKESKDDVFVLQKGYTSKGFFDTIETDGLVEVENSDIQKFYDLGYKGNIYKLYNYGIAQAHQGFMLEGCLNANNKTLYKTPYAIENRGVLVCDESFLIKQFGVDGKLNYLATASNQLDGGIIITDYLADCIIYYDPINNPTYNHIVGKPFLERAHINAIIETGYKDKYKDVLDEYNRLASSKNPEDKLKITEFSTDENYIAMLEYINTFLNIGYSFNQNFATDSIEYNIRKFTRIQSVEIYAEGGQSIMLNDLIGYYGRRENPVPKGQMHMPDTVYNNLFGTSLTDAQDPAFVPQKITLKKYPNYYSGERELIYEVELTIVGLNNSQYASFSDEEMELFRAHDIFPYALYFDDTSNVVNLNAIGKEINYVANSGYFKATSSITEIVVVFKDLFLLIAICLCIAGAMILISFGFSNVKKRHYEIGVMRALGTRMSDISLIFILQVLFAGILICALSSIGLYLAVGLANNILGESFMILLESAMLKDFEILIFDPITLVIDLAIVVAITIISAFAPIIAVHKVKPMQIIRAKE